MMDLACNWGRCWCVVEIVETKRVHLMSMISLRVKAEGYAWKPRKEIFQTFQQFPQWANSLPKAQQYSWDTTTGITRTHWHCGMLQMVVHWICGLDLSLFWASPTQAVHPFFLFLFLFLCIHLFPFRSIGNSRINQCKDKNLRCIGVREEHKIYPLCRISRKGSVRSGGRNGGQKESC